MRARYLHAIAAVSKRYNDGSAAADAYLDAITDYLAQPSEGNAEAFHALLRLFPLAAMMSRRYGRTDRYKAEAMGFIASPRPHLAAAQARVLIDVIEERNLLSPEDLPVLRDASRALIEALAGNDVELITALSAASEKILARLGEATTTAWRAEAAALEQRIAMTPAPLLVEMVGSRLLHLYGRLKDIEARRRLIERMRAARARQEFHTFSGQPEGWAEEVERLREDARRLVRDHGPIVILRFIGAARQFLPAVDEVRAQVERLEADGIGVFRQFAQTVVTHGERIVGHESSAFDEQYGYF